MPKAVQEVKMFNLGIVTSADDNDIKINAAVYSEDIDPNGIEGRLQGRKKDLLIELAHFRSEIDVLNPNPDDGSGGDIQREINADFANLFQHPQNPVYGFWHTDAIQMGVVMPPKRVDVNLVGTVPTQDVTIRFKIADFASPLPPRSAMLKLVSALGTPNTYANLGEYIDLTFTSANWEAKQSFWMEVQYSVLTDEMIHLDITATSDDAEWNVVELDSRLDFFYMGDNLFGFVIDESDFRLSEVVEGTEPFGGAPNYNGTHTGFGVGYRLSHHPYLATSTESVDLTITSDDATKFKVDRIGAPNTSFDAKTLSFTNANWDTFQYIYPFALEETGSQGHRFHDLFHTVDAASSDTFIRLEESLAGRWRFDGDNGHFGDGNDFPFSNLPMFPVIVWDSDESDNEDDGTGDDDEYPDKGWTKP